LRAFGKYQQQSGPSEPPKTGGVGPPPSFLTVRDPAMRGRVCLGAPLWAPRSVPPRHRADHHIGCVFPAVFLCGGAQGQRTFGLFRGGDFCGFAVGQSRKPHGVLFVAKTAQGGGRWRAGPTSAVPFPTVAQKKKKHNLVMGKGGWLGKIVEPGALLPAKSPHRLGRVCLFSASPRQGFLAHESAGV